MTETSFIVMGAKGRIDSVPDLLEKVNTIAKDIGIEVQLLDAAKVCGKEHLEVASMKAVRAFEEGRNHANSRPVEVLLYASAKRQITEAMEFMGIHEGDMEVAVVIFGAAGKEVPDDLIQKMGLEADDSVLRGSDKVLTAFGIDHERMREKIPPEKMTDLVLEKVALLDIEK